MATSDEKKALAGAALMMHVAWEALKSSAVDREQLVRLEEDLRTGSATLALYLQRDAQTLYLSAAALPAEFADPFDGEPLLRIQGPVAFPVLEFENLVDVVRS
jgi:hypothetical protein